ncbi:hypothetical protein Trydic_g3895 [Trypoxylus dichotomus]
MPCSIIETGRYNYNVMFANEIPLTLFAQTKRYRFTSALLGYVNLYYVTNGHITLHSRSGLPPMNNGPPAKWKRFRRITAQIFVNLASGDSVANKAAFLIP